MRVFKYLFVLISLASIINAQSSPSKCSYNGVDYGFLSNHSYSSTDLHGIYSYYFGVCKSPAKCTQSSNIGACQIKIGYGTNVIVGYTDSSSFNSDNGVTLHYGTESYCANGSKRNFNIKLVPSNDIQTPTVSDTTEATLCNYEVILKYPQSTPSSSSSSSPSSSSSTSISGSSSEPNPTSSSSSGSEESKIVCEKSNKSLKVQSYANITCSSYGPTSCVDSHGSKCESTYYFGSIKCSTRGEVGNEITCTGKSIVCFSDGLQCSLKSSVLAINGVKSDEDQVSIDMNAIGNSQYNSNDSIKLTFNIVVLLLIVSLTLLL